MHFGGIRAVDGVSLTLAAGKITGLIGPNGAGKTTLISMICGIVTPSSGSVSVEGYDVIKDYKKARELIGLVPQELYLDVPLSKVRALGLPCCSIP